MQWSMRCYSTYQQCRCFGRLVCWWLLPETAHLVVWLQPESRPTKTQAHKISKQHTPFTDDRHKHCTLVTYFCWYHIWCHKTITAENWGSMEINTPQRPQGPRYTAWPCMETLSDAPGIQPDHGNPSPQAYSPTMHGNTLGGPRHTAWPCMETLSAQAYSLTMQPVRIVSGQVVTA